MREIYKNIINKLFKGNPRTSKANKNIIASFAIKGGSIIIGFLLVRITLDYLDQTKYGIWLTMSSFLTWFSFFEIGLGSGLRNKLAEALAVKDYNLGRIYVSTTYAILTIVITVIALIFFIFNNFIDWTLILNTDKDLKKELSTLALIVFGFFFFRFIVKLIGIILYSDQRTAMSNFLSPLGNFISLIIIFIITKTTQSSLIYIGFVLSSVPVLIFIIASIYLFRNDYKNIAPSIKFINFKYARGLLSLGIKFFIIQVSALVLFQSSNIIIAQYFGPSEVTAYNIAYKYFGVINMMFTLIIMPFLPAFTEAWIKEDIYWIKKTIRSLLIIFVLFIILGSVLLLTSSWFFNLWIGVESMKTISISIVLKIALISQFLLFSFGGIFNMFINGIGKVKLQMLSLLIGAVSFFPITLFFINYTNVGIASVAFGTIIANFYSPFIAPIQYYKLVKKKANGIWNK